MEERKSANFLNARYWACCRWLRVLALCSVCFILYKAFRLQILEHADWVERERAQVQTTFEVPAYRGSIYDRQNRLLSFSVPQFSLCSDGELVENPKQLAAQLAPILALSEEGLRKKLSTSRRFLWLKRHMTDQQAMAVSSLKARGLTLIPEYKRFYPHRRVGGQVLGFVGMDGTGLEGIEKAFDKLLRQDGQTVGQLRDGVKKCLWLQPSPPPEPSESLGVRLTLDAFIQYASEVELEKNVEQYHARAGEVVVMDVRNFEVLAMANLPLFDPNLADKNKPELWRNRAVTDYFEPGSTFKVFLVSAALEEGTLKERDRIFCENGKCKLAGHMINDVHPYGWLTVPEVIKHSSNIASSKIALQLGAERYYRYIKGFGFGSPTGISLPGEAKGAVRHWKRWRPIDLATTGFGQSIGVTTLQLTQAIATIANGGESYQPVVASEIVDAQGKTVKKNQPSAPRRVIQKKTAAMIRDMMKGVTEEGGTGVNAAPEGYTAAGKTGTAQVLDPVTKRYASNKYTSLFTGFVPAEKPRLAITVAIHEPHGAIYGGVVAAPVFRNIAAKVLPYLGVPPSYTGANPAAPFRLVNATATDTLKAVAPGKKQATGKVQAAEASKTPGKVQKTAGKAQASEKTAGQPQETLVKAPSAPHCPPDSIGPVMPDVSGLSLKVALERLAQAGVRARFQGSGRVIGQHPQVGTPIDPKATAELVLNENHGKQF